MVHKVDSPGATPEGGFTDGDGEVGVPSTALEAKWHQMVQDELVAVVQAAGLELDDQDNTQLLQAIASKLPQPDRNQVVNGDFKVWQRGPNRWNAINEIPNNAGVFTADRWHFQNDNGGPATVTRRSFEPDQQDVPGAPERYLRIVKGFNGSNPGPTLRTRLEGIRQWGSRTIIVSFWARTEVGFIGGPFDPVLTVEQRFGTGGSAPVVVHTSELHVDEPWERHVVAIELPSILGKDFEQPGNEEHDRPGASLGLSLLLPTTHAQGLAFQIADVQVEFGETVTPYGRRTLAEDLARCLRYYEQSYEVGTVPGTATQLGATVGDEPAPNGEVQRVSQRFRAEKAVVPAMTWYSPITGAVGKIRYDGADRDVTATHHPSRSATGHVTVDHTQASSVSYGAHWTAEAEL